MTMTAETLTQMSIDTIRAAGMRLTKKLRFRIETAAKNGEYIYEVNSWRQPLYRAYR